MRAIASLFLTICSLGAQDFSNVSVEKVAAGLRFAEGPVWSREGFLLFSDVPNSRLMRLTPGKGTDTARENTNGASGNAFDKDGRLYSCETRGRRVVRTDRKGQLEIVAERWNGKRLNAPNDVAIRRDGHLWFTDPAFGYQQDTRELDFYGIFHLPPKGTPEPVLRWQTRPNGIALSPDGKILYVANADERTVRAYDVDGKGALSGERVVVQAIQGPPGGIEVDERGNLWIAATALAIYTAGGKLLRSIDMPETPSNCAFGDADLQTLYITARSSVYRIRMDVKGATP